MTMYEVNPDLFKDGKIIYAVEDAYRNYCPDFHSSIAQMYTYLKILYRTYLLCWVEAYPASFVLSRLDKSQSQTKIHTAI